MNTEAAITLDRTYWRVTTLAGRDLSPELDASVAFHNQRVSGRSGCNVFFADYSEQDNLLHVEEITTSRKICFSAVMQQEKLLLKTLASAVRYERNESGNLLIFSRTSRMPAVLRPISRAEMPVLAAR